MTRRSSSQIVTLALAVCVLLCAGQMASAAEFLLDDFNNSGFNYRWDFTESVGSSAVRLTSPTQGWGGAGKPVSFDLSSFSNGHVVVDFEVHPANSASTFAIELYDGNGNSGKWPFAASLQPVGQPVQLVHQNVLSNPPEGVGDFANLDLSNITGLQVLGEWGSTSPFDMSFDNLAVSTTATPSPTTYAGRSLNAAWRATAASQIDQFRKADLQINVVDMNGVAIPNATVSVEMQQHEFGFGTAVAAPRMVSNASENVIYRQKLAELFNQATIENNLKAPPWQGDWGNNFTQQKALATLNWLDAQGIEARGHAMVWPGYSNMPNSVKTLLDADPMTPAVQQAIRDAIEAHIDEVGAAASGLVRDWDVVNEPRTNHDVMDALPEGDQAMITWFQQAAMVDPNAKLFLNEFGILSSGNVTDSGNQQELIGHLNNLVAGGAPIDGVGLQAHFTDTQLSGPVALWSIIDQIAATGVEVQITEFDHTTSDSQLQADYMRDFLTAVFAHGDVTDFSTWGFWENSHWRPEAAFFDSNWNLKPNGQAFVDLVFGEWWTDESLMVDGVGTGTVRGFKGDYEVEATHAGILGPVTGTQLTTLVDGGNAVTVTLNTLLGDFNSSGHYSCDDINSLTGLIVGGSNLAPFDITGDGLVDVADLDAWLTHAGADLLASGGSFILGDANLDGMVDEADFGLWNANRFTSGAGWCGGDFNADGVTDVSDFNIWNMHRGMSALVAVPEPTVPLWFALIGLLLLRRCEARGVRLS